METRVGMRFAVDHDTAIYLQRTNYLLGPDPAQNQRLRLSLPSAAERRVADSSATRCVELHGHPQDLLSGDDWTRLHALGAKLGLSRSARVGIGNYFGWKLKQAKTKPKRILAFGCSTGMECIAIKALFPDARQVLLDFNLRIPEHWLEPLSVDATHECTLEDYAKSEPGTFDLVFLESYLGAPRQSGACAWTAPSSPQTGWSPRVRGPHGVVRGKPRQRGRGGDGGGERDPSPRLQ